MRRCRNSWPRSLRQREPVHLPRHGSRLLGDRGESDATIKTESGRIVQKAGRCGLLTLTALLGLATATTTTPAKATFATATGDVARSCSVEAAVRSVGKVFRGLSVGKAEEVVGAFVERKPIARYAWGFQIERPEEGPHGFREDAKSSRLIGTTVSGIERLVVNRRRQDESLELVAVVLDVTPVRKRVPITIYYLRNAKDVIGYGWGDGGIAKGEFDCDTGRLVWFRGGHIPNQVPIAAKASGRIVCARKSIRQREFVSGIGWGCAN